MKTETQPRVVRNPWHDKTLTARPVHYTLMTAPVFEHRGMEIFKMPQGGFLYVFGDMAITHRGAWDKTARIADDILDGRAPISDIPAAHLKANGFPKAMGWSDINALD
jgi:hypothetical protein